MPRTGDVYLKVKETIEKDVEAGKRPGSSRLLSENSYCDRLGVSRVTVRKAVDELIREGMLQRIPGKGIEIVDPSFRQEKPLYKRLAFVIRFSEDDDFFSRMVLACTQTANLYGYSYNIYNISQWRSQNIFSELLKSEIDGVLFTYYIHEPHTGNFQSVIDKGIPLVMVDNLPLSGEYPYVLSDDEKGGYLAASHLLSKGCRRILFIGEEIEEYTQAKRLEGYKRAVREGGFGEDGLRVLKIREPGEVYEQVSGIFAGGIEYDAVASFADGYVTEAYRALKDSGIRVPGQVALAGYGDSVAGRLLEVPLSTIEMPVFEMGRQACEMLINFLEGRGTLDKRILDVRLAERQSSGKSSG